MNLTLPELFTFLIHERHFYAAVANKLQRVEAPGLGTMAVGIRDGRMMLFYDPEFVKKVSMRFGVFVLDHEMYHLVFDHIPRYLELLSQFVDPGQRELASKVFQIAVDCADNTNQRKNPHFDVAQEETRAVILERRRQSNPEAELEEGDGMVLPTKYDLPEDKSFEFYQLELMKNANVQSGRGRQGARNPTEDELLDQIVQDILEAVGESHSRWIDDGQGEGKDGKGAGDGEKKPQRLSDLTPDQLQGLAHQVRTQARRILKQAQREQQKSRGLFPAGVAEWLDDFLADPVIPWWELLATRVRASKRQKPTRGIRQPNRSLLAMSEEDPSIIPAIGTTHEHQYRVFFYVDTSGSMDKESLQIARSELWGLLRADDDMEVRVMQGDAATHFDKLFHSGDEPFKEVHGRGGTDFGAYLAHMQQYCGNEATEPDIVVVYTDGYCPAPPPETWLPPEIPVVWLVSHGGTADYLRKSGYGEVIFCDHNQNEGYANK